tara:strand:- start:162 stop:314 length:153 start_codon:yes stop_codon:yes gene_type:complete
MRTNNEQKCCKNATIGQYCRTHQKKLDIALTIKAIPDSIALYYERSQYET